MRSMRLCVSVSFSIGTVPACIHLPTRIAGRMEQYECACLFFTSVLFRSADVGARMVSTRRVHFCYIFTLQLQVFTLGNYCFAKCPVLVYNRT